MIRAALLALVCMASGAFAAPPLFDRLPPEVKKAGVLRFVGDSHPPYRILSDDRRISDGIDFDLAHALEPVLGVRIVHATVNSLSATLAGLESGRYDVAMGPALPNKERLQRFDSVTWLVSYPTFVYPLGKPRRFAKLTDLCGLKAAYVAGSVSERVADRVSEHCAKFQLQPMQHVPLVDTNMTLVATQAGRADVAAMTSTAALHVVHEAPRLFGAFRDPGDVLRRDVLGLFVTRRSNLAPVLRDALAELFKNGEYQRVMAKWGVDAVAVPSPQLHTLGTAAP